MFYGTLYLSVLLLHNAADDRSSKKMAILEERCDTHPESAIKLHSQTRSVILSEEMYRDVASSQQLVNL